MLTKIFSPVELVPIGAKCPDPSRSAIPDLISAYSSGCEFVPCQVNLLSFKTQASPSPESQQVYEAEEAVSEGPLFLFEAVSPPAKRRAKAITTRSKKISEIPRELLFKNFTIFII